MTILSDSKQREVVATMKTRSAAAELRKHVPQQLAFWPEERRAIANELARCALFRAGDSKKPRHYFDNEPLYMLGEGGITYKGEELRGRDEDIFITLAHCARSLPSGKMVVKVTNSEICKLNNWRQGQAYYDEIYASIQRMKGGVITVFSRRLAKALKCQRALEAGASDEELAALYDDLTRFEQAEARARNLGLPVPEDDDKKAGMMMSLIGGDPIFTGFKSIKDGIPQGNLTWEITLDGKMVSLFAAPYLTYLDREHRQKLSPSGRRLQAYYLSHEEPYGILMRNLEKMIGLSYKDTKKLKYKLNEELTHLRDLGVIHDFGFEKAASGDDWKVLVHREKPDNSK